MIEEQYYYTSFEDDWFQHRLKLEKVEENSWRNKPPAIDFSGEKREQPDYDPWTDSYY